MPETQNIIQPDFSIRSEIRRQHRMAKHIKQGEINNDEEFIYDDIYDSSDGYALEFSQVLPGRMKELFYAPLFPGEFETHEQSMHRIEDFNQYLIGNILKDRIGQAIGIDLAGPGRNFFNQYKGIFKRSLGVVLNDIYPRPIPENHQVIESNILSSSAHRDILNWLDNEKADFIMESVGGCGTDGIKGSLQFLYLNLKWYYSILREGGVMFFQHNLYFEDVKDFVYWVKWLNKNFDKTVTINTKSNLVRLNKYPGAPEQLPSNLETTL